MPSRPVLPADNEVFDLTLAPGADPEQMLTNDGYHGWTWHGKRINPTTALFKLVRTREFLPNLEEVKDSLLYGYRFNGIWREAFKKRFPIPDGMGPIGFPDDSWHSPSGDPFFPALFEEHNSWHSFFHGANQLYKVRWRWLIPVGKTMARRRLRW